MENTSAGDLIELFNFDISVQCFGSLGAFCVRNALLCQAVRWYRQQCEEF